MPALNISVTRFKVKLLPHSGGPSKNTKDCGPMSFFITLTHSKNEIKKASIWCSLSDRLGSSSAILCSISPIGVKLRSRSAG